MKPRFFPREFITRGPCAWGIIPSGKKLGPWLTVRASRLVSKTHLSFAKGPIFVNDNFKLDGKCFRWHTLSKNLSSPHLVWSVIISLGSDDRYVRTVFSWIVALKAFTRNGVLLLIRGVVCRPRLQILTSPIQEANALIWSRDSREKVSELKS